MHEPDILNADVLKQFALVNEDAITKQLVKVINLFDKKIVVLDDDPTGVQTVHNVPVYTDWTVQTFLEGLREEGRIFFILTNSRGFTSEQTQKAHHEIVSNLFAASKESGIDFLLISRSDSTLRGHYPLETEYYIPRQCG